MCRKERQSLRTSEHASSRSARYQSKSTYFPILHVIFLLPPLPLDESEVSSIKGSTCLSPGTRLPYITSSCGRFDQPPLLCIESRPTSSVIQTLFATVRSPPRLQRGNQVQYLGEKGQTEHIWRVMKTPFFPTYGVSCTIRPQGNGGLYVYTGS